MKSLMATQSSSLASHGHLYCISRYAHTCRCPTSLLGINYSSCGYGLASEASFSLVPSLPDLFNTHEQHWKTGMGLGTRLASLVLGITITLCVCTVYLYIIFISSQWAHDECYSTCMCFLRGAGVTALYCAVLLVIACLQQNNNISTIDSLCTEGYYTTLQAFRCGLMYMYINGLVPAQ